MLLHAAPYDDLKFCPVASETPQPKSKYGERHMFQEQKRVGNRWAGIARSLSLRRLEWQADRREEGQPYRRSVKLLPLVLCNSKSRIATPSNILVHCINAIHHLCPYIAWEGLRQHAVMITFRTTTLLDWACQPAFALLTALQHSSQAKCHYHLSVIGFWGKPC